MQDRTDTWHLQGGAEERTSEGGGGGSRRRRLTLFFDTFLLYSIYVPVYSIGVPPFQALRLLVDKTPATSATIAVLETRSKLRYVWHYSKVRPRSRLT